MELSPRFRSEMIEALEGACEYIADVDGGRASSAEVARRFIEALRSPSETESVPSDAADALGRTESKLARWIEERGFVADIADVDLERLLDRILALAGILFETPRRRLPERVETALRRRLHGIATEIFEKQGPEYLPRVHVPSVDDQDLERLGAVLCRELPDDLPSPALAVRIASRAAGRRTPVDLDPATNLVEHVIRAVRAELGISFGDPPRRVDYQPGVVLRVGDTVVHRTFGEGQVIRLRGGKAEVRFRDRTRELVCRGG